MLQVGRPRGKVMVAFLQSGMTEELPWLVTRSPFGSLTRSVRSYLFGEMMTD
jgi:hypothetical protein